MWVLLLPQGHERGLEPAAQGNEAMDAGMAGGAKRNQQARVMDARPAMVDGEFLLSATGAAAVAVAPQDLVAVAGKALARVKVTPITARAEPGTKELEAAAGAEEPGLRERPRGKRGRRRGQAPILFT